MAATSAARLEPVAQITARLHALLQHARSVKPIDTVDPPLPTTELYQNVDELHDGLDERYDQTYCFATAETAARAVFYSLLSVTNIEDPAFIEVWNLLDILLLCGDRGKCTPELGCWLIEELLDSQTTTGCRIVFDYLESRRERLASKDFHRKNLVFLRACNELLRRLSRAEDAIFCGRVFFFLFQTFPLGDKSSVNLRGEFHAENMTKFEVSEPTASGDGIETVGLQKETSQPPAKPGVKSVVGKSSKKGTDEVLSNDQLYPIFWRLQRDFCEPTRLFTPETFADFKKGLAATMAKFKDTPTVVQTKVAEDNNKRGIKRKADGEDDSSMEATDHFVDNYNPKYLTSRDLFGLELNDLAFQRHIMVQALILIDFLLSLTERAKRKSAVPEATNKSMLYAFALGDDDMKWATTTRSDITTYLQSFGDGRFYCRMVETVLARDKNWVRWKVESCPSILRDPVPTEMELEARNGARHATRPRYVPERANHAMDFSFLDEGSHGGGLAALKCLERYTAPSLEDLINGIKTDELDLEMAMDDVERASLEDGISNKTWRALRQARARRLDLLDRVEPGKGLEEVFVRPQKFSRESESELEMENIEGHGDDVGSEAVTQ